MQTFLPYPDFKRSAESLDYRRLGKQRVEVLQILKALTGTSVGWSNHPCVKMWRPTRNALVVYGLTICEVWRDKGYNDSCWGKIRCFWQDTATRAMPEWFENVDFHRSHMSNLLRKDVEFYSESFGKDCLGVPNNLPYIWPTVD